MDVYINLTYRQYKQLEDQLRDFDSLETTHTSVDGYHHKAFRIVIDDLELEFHGPIVKKPKN